MNSYLPTHQYIPRAGNSKQTIVFKGGLGVQPTALGGKWFEVTGCNHPAKENPTPSCIIFNTCRIWQSYFLWICHLICYYNFRTIYIKSWQVKKFCLDEERKIWSNLNYSLGFKLTTERDTRHLKQLTWLSQLMVCFLLLWLMGPGTGPPADSHCSWGGSDSTESLEERELCSGTRNRRGRNYAKLQTSSCPFRLHSC